MFQMLRKFKLIKRTTIKSDYEHEQDAVAWLNNNKYKNITFNHTENFVYITGERIEKEYTEKE